MHSISDLRWYIFEKFYLDKELAFRRFRKKKTDHNMGRANPGMVPSQPGGKKSVAARDDDGGMMGEVLTQL